MVSSTDIPAQLIALETRLYIWPGRGVVVKNKPSTMINTLFIPKRIINKITVRKPCDSGSFNERGPKISPIITPDRNRIRRY
jgi:hypothetical protein